MRARGIVAAFAFTGILGLGGCQYFVPSHHKITGYTPLVAAADCCDVDMVKNAVENDPGAIRTSEWEHVTLLHEAIGHDCDKLAAYFINAGADANARKSDGVTPLHLAAQRGMVPTIELLLQHHAHINAVDSTGWTPLDRAELWKKPEAADYLRRHGGIARRATSSVGSRAGDRHLTAI